MVMMLKGIGLKHKYVSGTTATTDFGRTHGRSMSGRWQVRAEMEPIRVIAKSAPPDNSSLKSEDAAMCVSVGEFLAKHDLEDIYAKALDRLKSLFGDQMKPDVSIFVDPSDGSRMVMVTIRDIAPDRAQKRLSKFCYDWWYDQRESDRDLLGFRVSA